MGVRERRHKNKERLERTDDAGLLTLKMMEETTTQAQLVTFRRSAAPRDHFRLLTSRNVTTKIIFWSVVQMKNNS